MYKRQCVPHVHALQENDFKQLSLRDTAVELLIINLIETSGSESDREDVD